MASASGNYIVDAAGGGGTSASTSDIADDAGGGLGSASAASSFLDRPTTNDDQANDFDNDNNELKASIDAYLPRTLYINGLHRLGIDKMNVNDILADITKQYQIEKFKHHGKYLRLIFHSKEMADFAAGKNITLGGKQVTLSKPGDRAPIKTLHLFGIPFGVPDEKLREFLASQGLKTSFPGRFIKYKDTNIDSEGRSIVVQTSPDFIIPPRLVWRNTAFVRGQITVRVWYHGMPDYCKRCAAIGHRADRCTEFPPLPSEQSKQYRGEYEPSRSLHSNAPTSNYYDPVKYFQDEQYVALNDFVMGKIKNITEKQAGINEVVETVVANESYESDELYEQAESEISHGPQGVMQDSSLPEAAKHVLEYKLWERFIQAKQQKSAPLDAAGECLMSFFYSRHPDNAFMSNFYTGSPFTIWGETFTSVEQFVGVWKARLAGDLDIAAKIMAETNPGKIKRLHSKVKWQGDICHYARVMVELIYAGNWAKFEQSAELRQKLFSTAGLLVESNTGKSQWSCGLACDNPDTSDRSKWPEGCLNLNGDLLTFLRHEMATTAPFSDEFGKLVAEKVSRYSTKRPREKDSPETGNKRPNTDNDD